jgi:hypothetical protein
MTCFRQLGLLVRSGLKTNKKQIILHLSLYIHFLLLLLLLLGTHILFSFYSVLGYFTKYLSFSTTLPLPHFFSTLLLYFFYSPTWRSVNFVKMSHLCYFLSILKNLNSPVWYISASVVLLTIRSDPHTVFSLISNY